MFAYVGSRTTRERNARGDGITVWSMDEATGDLTPVQTVGDFLDKPVSAGGLALSRYSASAALLTFIVVAILLFRQRAARTAH